MLSYPMFTEGTNLLMWKLAVPEGLGRRIPLFNTEIVNQQIKSTTVSGAGANNSVLYKHLGFLLLK